MTHAIPVLLLTGYLGSGKTTLLNRILTNEQGLKFAVIVNDIGEVNIDATLIQQGGIVDQKDESLVALQNGCICCTLKMDLVEQLREIVAMHKFDYIVIEASGICEPAPIAQTICSIPTMEPKYWAEGLAKLDCIVTVVDALRMRDEFANGEALTSNNIAEEDIENLVIQQIEFCNIVLLNKAAEVTPSELARIKEIVRALQPKAEIIECNYGDVDLKKIVDTQKFDFNEVATSAAWIAELDKKVNDNEDDNDNHNHNDNEDDDDNEEHEHHHHHHHHDHEDEHEHHHHHHHHDDDDEDEDEHEHHHHHHDHDEDEHHHHHHHDHPEGCTCGHCHHNEETGEAEEYGIGTYVYYSRKPFNLGLFDDFVARLWPKNIIRAKGLCYFKGEDHICYLFEQAGKQFSLKNCGQWYATMPQDQLDRLFEAQPDIKADWDDEVGDRMQKLVFIGQKLDRKELKKMLDKCLTSF